MKHCDIANISDNLYVLTVVQCVAFPDVQPQAPVHFIVIPKRQIAEISQCDVADKQVIGRTSHVSVYL